MKFNKSLIFFILLSNIVFSQTGEVYYKKKLISSEKSTNPLVVQGLKQLDNQEFKLSFNQEAAFYKKVNKMSLENTNSVVESFANSFAGFRGEAYFDRIKNKVILIKEIYGKTYLININEINWKLSKDTLKIGTYLCYKATTIRTIKNDKGTHELNVIAWYTVDIPLPYGPDGYGGLPGLILQLEDNGNLTIIKKIEFLKNKTESVSFPTKGDEITEEEFNQLVLKTFENRKN